MLVDTSVWIDHFRRGDAKLAKLLESGEVECHPFVIGELACGSLQARAEILSLLRKLPQTPLVEHEEALAFVDGNKLAASGLGWIDVHLLASARLGGTLLWSRDRRLAATARRFGLAVQ
jgi:predicted nucleic acid-binding protein